MTEIWDPQIADNVEAFVLFLFPWGKENTPLHNVKGPRSWQRDELQQITEHIKTQKEKMAQGLAPSMYQSATASGRGIGKSALTNWLNIWMMSTHLGSTSIVTANTEDQLKSKTWAELGKWHTLALNSHWFEKNALSLKPSKWFSEALKSQLQIDDTYYYSHAQLWSEEKPEAFAGVHNQNGVMVIMDEASGIPKVIWTVTDGFFTEPTLHRYWFCFSNPRRNTGEFFECFHKNRNSWFRRNVDSRTVEGTDTAKLQQIIDRHGEDSDEARAEVKGVFPRQGDQQFISRELIEDAQVRVLVKDEHAPLIMGVDVARYGDDSTVFSFRQGRDARSIPQIVLKSRDNMQVASAAADWIMKTNPDAVCVDAGAGAGVIDRLKQLGFKKIHEINCGSVSSNPRWANKRTELWDLAREWLKGGCLPINQDLEDDLSSPRYRYHKQTGKPLLEPKEEMKSRGLSSPDRADSLVFTFAVKVPHRDIRTSRFFPGNRARIAPGIDYKVFS